MSDDMEAAVAEVLATCEGDKGEKEIEDNREREGNGNGNKRGNEWMRRCKKQGG